MRIELILGALLSVSVVVQARATVITFDDTYANSIVFVPFLNSESFSDGGLTFTDNGNQLFVWPSYSPNSNGTNNLIFLGDVNDSGRNYITITRYGGGRFDVTSVDMSLSWYDANANDTVNINGQPYTLIQGMQTYNLDLLGITELTITGGAKGGGYWILDNLDYNSSPVPESGSVILLGSGLLALTGFARRKTA